MRPRNIFKSLSLPVERTSSGGSNNNNNKVAIPSTLYNHDEEEVDKLTQFKQMVKCYNIPSSADDSFYMKWLKARGFDLDKAHDMLKKHLEWRENCEYLHGIMNYIAPPDVLDQFKWKRLGEDEDGRLVYCFRAGQVDVRYLLENHHLDAAKRYLHKVLELLLIQTEEQRQLTGYGKAIAIVDIAGFTFYKAMSVELIQLGLYFARIFEANYPEALYKAYALNANWFFSSVFNTIKPILSNETTQKIHVLGSDQSKYLPELMEAIPIDIIPEEYGGNGESIEDFEEIP